MLLHVIPPPRPLDPWLACAREPLRDDRTQASHFVRGKSVEGVVDQTHRTQHFCNEMLVEGVVERIAR